MNCRIYENTCCINESKTEENFNDYCCHECLIHVAVEHDKLLEEGIISGKCNGTGRRINKGKLTEK